MKPPSILGDDTQRHDQPEEPFWSRQFSKDVTVHQSAFDVFFGIVAPILCFIFDPIVFKNRLGVMPLDLDLTPFKLLVYFFSALSILTLLLWLKLKDKSGLLNAIVAGILLSGSVGSLVIGILILPLTLIGLLFLVGVFGFIPFFTAFVYLRNGVRALNAAKPFVVQPKLTGSVLLGAVLVIGPSVLVQWQINRVVRQSMNDLLRGDMQAAESATRKLRYCSWATDLDQVVWSYSRETDETRKDALAKAYKEITGKDIDNRLAFLLD
jgi:hypothetical protein